MIRIHEVAIGKDSASRFLCIARRHSAAAPAIGRVKAGALGASGSKVFSSAATILQADLLQAFRQDRNGGEHSQRRTGIAFEASLLASRGDTSLYNGRRLHGHEAFIQGCHARARTCSQTRWLGPAGTPSTVVSGLWSLSSWPSRPRRSRQTAEETLHNWINLNWPRFSARPPYHDRAPPEACPRASYAVCVMQVRRC